MQTERDAEIVRWLGRIGAASAENVMARFGMGRSWAYDRLSRLVRDGLLEQKTLLHRQPGLYIATAEGLRWTLQERLGVYRVSAGGFAHAAELATLAVQFFLALPQWGQMSERELRIAEADEDKLLASVKLGELPGGRPALHRPDLALIDGEGHVLAIELELSIKAPRRLQAICRAYARARHLAHVYYLTTPAVGRAVLRAVAEVRAEDRVTVMALENIAGVADAVDGSARHAWA
jgi:hypothetical protein